MMRTPHESFPASGPDVVGNGSGLIDNNSDFVANRSSLIANGSSLIANGSSLIANGSSLIANGSSFVGNALTNAPQSDRLIEQLTRKLHRDCHPTSDRFLDWNMTPELAYGRHRGPARVRSRRAAVAVVLMHDSSNQWSVPLTRRPTSLRHHGGQICFPGGRIEPGETASQAALREFEEELGLPVNVIANCGQLPDQYVYASDNRVTPIVFVARRPEKPWCPDPVEVDEVLELPLATFTHDCTIEPISQTRSIRTHPSRGAATLRHPPIHRPGDFKTSDFRTSAAKTTGPSRTSNLDIRFRAPSFAYQDWRIWGATAVMLDQLAQCLLDSSGTPAKKRTSAKLASSGI